MAQVYQPSDYCFTVLEIGATFEWFTNNGVFYIKLKAFYLIIMLCYDHTRFRREKLHPSTFNCAVL